VVDSSDSKTLYGGTRKLVIVLNDVSSVDDATQRANAILDQSKDAFSNFTIKYYDNGASGDITPRFIINYNDYLKNISYTNLAIVTIKKSWPEITTSITLGKPLYTLNGLMMSVEERVKKIERTKQNDVLLRVNKVFNEEYYFILEDVEISTTNTGSGFILGDATYGILAQSFLGDNSAGATYVYVVKRKYNYDTATLLGTGTSDANIDISSGKIEFI